MVIPEKLRACEHRERWGRQRIAIVVVQNVLYVVFLLHIYVEYIYIKGF